MPDVPGPLESPPRPMLAHHEGRISSRLDAKLARGRAGGNSLDNTLRVAHRVPATDWVLADVRVSAVADGFGHGLVHLWSEDGTLLGTASQSSIVRVWRDDPEHALTELEGDVKT
jgi:hypothetical protein